MVDPLSVDSIEGHNRVSGKGFPTTGPRIEAGNVIIHRGLHVTRPLDVACVLFGCRELLADRPRCWMFGVIDGVRIGNAYSNCGCSCLNLYYLTGKAYGGACALRICASFGSTRLICASFGSTRLICPSFGSTRLMCASFGSTRLICASFGSTRLICAFYGTTRLLCRVRAQLGTDRREAERMREGHMDTSGFLLLPLCILSEYLVCDFELMT
ncbi:DNA-directed RNA polymerase I subunit RPA1-like [Cucumis melo var. makuwa]|uniref:DNA-directed RNA polymerase I subunit RPA1-like n=1 Tax=Cucumis melo var. makuwa TaxID=1194695 RepID=A0A5D3C5W1_CUCMM|nr:DNA-directed RNA polymerase I subunit RPA1-like [Cucumis melo var. makuwa]